MIVGIVSDTHGRLPIKADAELAGCDHIIHAGDICDTGILRFLGNYAPVTAVLGNNDYPEYGPNVGRYAEVELEGVRFLVAHFPRDVMGKGLAAAIHATGRTPDVCIHGHTHIPRLLVGAEAHPAQLVVCPGSCCLPRGGSPASIARLVVEKGRIRSAEIVRIADGSVYQELTLD